MAGKCLLSHWVRLATSGPLRSLRRVLSITFSHVWKRKKKKSAHIKKYDPSPFSECGIFWGSWTSITQIGHQLGPVYTNLTEDSGYMSPM